MSLSSVARHASLIGMAVVALQAASPSAAGAAQPPSELTAAGKRPDAARAAFLALTEQARRALYPDYDEGTLNTGESFDSPSLARHADDMVLLDFNLAPLADPAESARPGWLVASALLKPVGFPVSYTLLEVAVLAQSGGAVVLNANLKVRVDSGDGDGRLSMRLEEPPRLERGAVRFDVVIVETGRSLRHRFIARAGRIRLIESLPLR